MLTPKLLGDSSLHLARHCLAQAIQGKGRQNRWSACSRMSSTYPSLPTVFGEAETLTVSRDLLSGSQQQALEDPDLQDQVLEGSAGRFLKCRASTESSHAH